MDNIDMKNFVKVFRLTIVMCVFLSIGYILVLWLFAKAQVQATAMPKW